MFHFPLVSHTAPTSLQDDLCSAHDVRGYPTIKYYVNGVEEAYNGGRSYDDLKRFVQDTLEVKCDIDNR